MTRFCECGCGEPVVVPRRFVWGHNLRRLRRQWPSASARFWARVERPESSMCVIWTGGRNSEGYGQLRVGGRTVFTHRYAFEQARGEIPRGMVVHHRCGNRACVHPLHLSLLGHAEHARHHLPRSATCRVCGGSDWRDGRDGRRDCRTCRARRERERAADPAYRARRNAYQREWRTRRKEVAER